MMSVETFFHEPHAWLDAPGPANDVVISSRVRLARNVVEIPFPARLDKSGQQAILEQVRTAAQQTPSLAKSRFLDLKTLKKIERQFLVERHLISPEMAFEESERGVLISQGQEATLMINEEDHMRLQSFEAGMNLRKAWARADKIDTELSERLPIAFDAEWGYCTRCPTNVGTALRASCLLHLPALAMNGDIDRVLDGLPQMGVTARGFYGERSKALGDLFQISNATSLGRSEQELMENVEHVVESLAHYERQARAAFADAKHRLATEDIVFRAWGILINARMISYDEAMQHLSHVRLGVEMGLDVPTRMPVLNQLMLLTQPAHLQLLKGGSLKTEERDRFRAAMLREKLEVK